MRLRSGLIALFGTASLVVSLAMSSAPAAAGLLPPQTPSISNLPDTATYGDGGFTASVTNNNTSDGTPSVTSSTPSVCAVDPGDDLTVTYTGAGTCTLTAHTAETLFWDAADGDPQSFTVAQATPNPLTINDIPASPTFGDSGFTATLDTDSDGTPSVTSSTPSVCSVDSGDNVSVTYAGAGTCTLTPHTAATIDYLAADGTAQSFTGRAGCPEPAEHHQPPGGRHLRRQRLHGGGGDQ